MCTKWDEFVESLSDKDFLCPICFKDFDSREDKTKHITDEHGFVDLGEL